MTDLLDQAVTEILSLLPEAIHGFSGSQYPAPVRTALLGGEEPDLALLRRQLEEGRLGDPKDVLEPLLLAAEIVEAAQPDKADYFLGDRKVQAAVFSGSKWRAGWALVLGGGDQTELVARLKDRSFMVVTDGPGIADTTYIGDRPTSPVYFLQLMLRYGLVWGGISPGDDHEMGHFLERDMPGLVIVAGDLPPLKYLMALGLMKLGAPAIVPSTYPFPYGNRIVADTVDDIVERAGEFPNLRRRYFEDEVISLPEPCNPAHANEPFTVARSLGGGHSFFCLRAAPEPVERLTVVGEDGDEVGVLVEVAEEGLPPDVEQLLEKAALKAVSFIPGLRAYEEEGGLRIDLAEGASLNEALLADAIYWGIRLQYPRLRRIGVRVVRDAAALADAADEVCRHKVRREAAIEAMTEANVDEFCACTECRPFSLVHTCILTPERPSMCASRTYASTRAAALYGSTQVPWKRRSERRVPLRLIFAKGRQVDGDSGEYEGCNRVYRQLTDGRLERVFLHSLRGHPHTSCGCFQALAFWIPEVEGIGIMQRNSDAVTPDGRTWETLANRAGGKQSPGIAGVSLQYIHSPAFLRGDGGIANVVWVDAGLHKRVAAAFRPGQRVATEADVSTTEQLRAFVGR